MSSVGPVPLDPIGQELAEWGKVLVLETTGRVSGRAVRAAVGYVEEPDGSCLVAASTPDTHWGLNLLHDPRLRVTREASRRTAARSSLRARNATTPSAP